MSFFSPLRRNMYERAAMKVKKSTQNIMLETTFCILDINTFLQIFILGHYV